MDSRTEEKAVKAAILSIFGKYGGIEDKFQQISCKKHGEVASMLNGECPKCNEEHEQHEQNEAMNKRLRLVKKQAGVFEVFLDFSFDTIKPKNEKQDELFRKVRVFNFKNNLFFYGGTGVGKTLTACCLLDKALKKNLSAKYLKISKIADIKVNDYKSYLDLFEYRFLVLDEIGRFDNSLANNVLFDLLDERTSNKLSTLFITNLNAEEIKKKFDAAFLSRLKANTQFIAFKEGDFRNLKKDK